MIRSGVVPVGVGAAAAQDARDAGDAGGAVLVAHAVLKEVKWESYGRDIGGCATTVLHSTLLSKARLGTMHEYRRALKDRLKLILVQGRNSQR